MTVSGDVRLDIDSVEYWKLRNKGLGKFGASYVTSSMPEERVNKFDPAVSIEKWNLEENTLLISKGCAVFPGRRPNYGTEFIVECGQGEEFASKLLTITIYFHLTVRPVLPADVLEIGTMKENSFGFSHVYISVPFFLPREVNFIKAGDADFALNWVMPVFSAEAEFIQLKGTDEFEERLLTSGYDFFDMRSNLDYLLA